MTESAVMHQTDRLEVGDLVQSEIPNADGGHDFGIVTAATIGEAYSPRQRTGYVKIVIRCADQTLLESTEKAREWWYCSGPHPISKEKEFTDFAALIAAQSAAFESTI